MAKRFALVHPIWFSFPIEKRVSRLFRNLGAFVVVLCNLRLVEAGTSGIGQFTFYRLESGRECVVDGGLYDVLFPLYTRLSKRQLN